MTYSESRSYIEALKGRGIVPGLKNIELLCEKIGNPQNRLNFIHIAGTNGKGSVGAFLESILMRAGYKTARFVSPSVGDYLEMYTINMQNVSETAYAECSDRIKQAADMLEKDGVYPTSFEAETAIAFLLFSKYNADIVLLECGMGGLYDCTNVIPSPELAIITSVSKDHCAFLGDTLFEIAAHKCGIIKHDTTVITCRQSDEVMQTIQDTCCKNNASLFIADNISDVTYGTYTSFTYNENRYNIKLLGSYQPQNAAIAAEAALRLGISYDIVYDGLKTAQWGFRFERTGKYILDGAHNPAAAIELAKSLKIYQNRGKTAFIAGIFKDKEYDKIAEITAGCADAVYTVSPPPPRGLDSIMLADAFKKYNKNTHDGISLENAIELTRSYDTVVIFGSLSILCEAKHLITKAQKEGTGFNAAL